MQGSGGLEPPGPGGDDEDSVRSVTNSEQSEEEKAKWNKKDCVHPQLIYVISKLRSTSFLTINLVVTCPFLALIRDASKFPKPAC